MAHKSQRGPMMANGGPSQANKGPQQPTKANDGGLYCPPLILAGIRRNPGIPGILQNKIWLGNQPNQNSIPVEFRGDLNSGRMVPGISGTEWVGNGPGTESVELL